MSVYVQNTRGQFYANVWTWDHLHNLTTVFLFSWFQRKRYGIKMIVTIGHSLSHLNTIITLNWAEPSWTAQQATNWRYIVPKI